MQAMSGDGTGASSELQSAIDILEAMPPDGAVCEGPHAHAKRSKDHATSAKIPVGCVLASLGAEPRSRKECPAPASEGLLAQFY